MLDLFLRSKSNTFVGIEINCNAVRLLALAKKNAANFKVLGLVEQPLPLNAMVQDEIKDSSVVITALKQAAASIPKDKDNAAAVAMSSGAIITKIIQLDRNLSGSVMEEQVWIRASEILSTQTADMSLDFCLLESDELSKDQNRVSAMLVAARTEKVNLYVEILNAAGFDVKIVDVDYFALANACQYLAAKENVMLKQATIAIFNFEAPHLMLVVMHKGNIVYTREITLEKNVLAVHKILSADELITQMQHALQFFYSVSSSRKIEHVVLSGGSLETNNTDFATQIKQTLGIDTMIANPFKDMQLDANVDQAILEHNAPSFVISFGLGLRGFDNDTY